MIPLYEHQKNILAENKLWHGIFTGTGSAKTRTALELAEGKILVIMPKQQFLDKTWEKNAEKFGIKKDITTISKETFRRDWRELPRYDTVIIDECHNNLGVLPEMRQRKRVQIPKTSQMFEATLLYIKKYPPKRLYLCSATPVSKPMNMWAVAKILGVDWDFEKFRATFYFKTLMGRREVWMPRKDEETKQRLAGLVQRFGYTGALNDFVDVPAQTHKEVYIDLTEEQKIALKKVLLEEADPLVRRARQRTIENGVLYGQEIENIKRGEQRMVKKTTIFPSKKIDYILERAVEFPKLLIFANYTAQINEIARVLRDEGYEVSTLTGETKDRGPIVENAEKSKAHIVIAQSGISAGYELPSFPCVIYASKSFQYVHYEQSLGRVLRINKLKKNLFIHLVVHGADADCHKAIMSGVDFQEKLSTL
jgi:superfamily II DNA or RNA helicase